MAARVVIYTTPWCGYCVSAKALLRKRGIAFDEIDVGDDAPARAHLLDVTGSSTVPQVFIDGRSVGGCDDLHALDRSGKLEQMLKVS